jgi:uncharacterized protein YPO0396
MTLTAEQKLAARARYRSRRQARKRQLEARERRIAEEIAARLATERQEWIALLDELARALRDIPQHVGLIPLIEGDIARIHNYPPGLLPWLPDRQIFAEILHQLKREAADDPVR